MAASDHLGPMFHGSQHEFKPGDIVGANYSAFDDEEGKRASATDSAFQASLYSGTSGKVYKVEPVNADDVEVIDHGEDGKHYRSSSGYRVIDSLWD